MRLIHYINYLIPYAPHLFQNKQFGQQNERKYIGIVLIVNDMNYFAPLSSFKAKHERMKNAAEVYKHKLNNGDTTALAKRCNDFKLLEEKSKKYKSNLM